MIKLYKTIIPMGAILSLVTSMVLILSLIGSLNAPSLHGLIEDRVINTISEPFTLILLGIGLIGIAGISRKILNKLTA